MNAIETIIDAASPLTDYQQLILDCRIYSENEIKKHCILPIRNAFFKRYICLPTKHFYYSIKKSPFGDLIQ